MDMAAYLNQFSEDIVCFIDAYSSGFEIAGKASENDYWDEDTELADLFNASLAATMNVCKNMVDTIMNAIDELRVALDFLLVPCDPSIVPVVVEDARNTQRSVVMEVDFNTTFVERMLSFLTLLHSHRDTAALTAAPTANSSD